MNKPSHAKDLSINLDEEDRKREQEYEQRFQSSMERVLKSFNDTGERGLATIERTTADWNRRLNTLAFAGWMRPLVLGLSISLGIYGAHWAAKRWTADQVKSLTSRKATLQAEIESQEKTIETLKEKTWGVLMHEDDEGRFVVFPKGEVDMDEWKGWTFRGRAAWRLKDQ